MTVNLLLKENSFSKQKDPLLETITGYRALVAIETPDSLFKLTTVDDIRIIPDNSGKIDGPDYALTGQLIGMMIKIHRKLGPGLLESVYEKILCYELIKADLKYECQKRIDFNYEGQSMEIGIRADLIIEDRVIIELKSVEAVAPVHFKQLLTYMKLTDIRVGLLVNFNVVYLHEGIHRVMN